MPNDNLFHPYKIINQSNSSLELQAGNGPKVVRAAFLASPIILLIAGAALYITQKQLFFLYLMIGIAALELLIFSFIRVPTDLRMDSMGFTLKTISIRNTQEKDYLWSDVDRIRQRISRTKNGNVLNYEAVLKEGKKVRILSFNNYNPKKKEATAINSVLSQISHKPITDK